MARILGAMPAGAGRQKYPWGKWFDGRVWQLTEGEDFTCAASSMRNGAYQVAKRRGIKLRASLDKDGRSVYLQAERDSEVRP